MFIFCKQKTAYEMRISDWSSDVCSSDLVLAAVDHVVGAGLAVAEHQRAGMAKIEHHDGVGNARFGNVDARFRDDERIVSAFLGLFLLVEIGRASGRERVCQYG